jgi:hypothetical protein
MQNENILSENEVVNYLADWLQKQNWKITKKALNYQHGNDIEAEKNRDKLIIEAKGAKPNNPKKTHTFNATQIQVHFGKALVKIMEQQTLFPNAQTGIAQPDAAIIKETLKVCLPQVKNLGIKLYWVQKDGKILVE